MKTLRNKRIYFMMENAAGHNRLLFTYPELATETFANKKQIGEHIVHGSEGSYMIPVYRENTQGQDSSVGRAAD